MNQQHTGNTSFTPCPIGRKRRRVIAAAMLAAVGLVDAMPADGQTSIVGAPPSYSYRVALPVVEVAR